MRKILLTYLLFIGTLISAQITLGSGTASGGASSLVATVPWSTYYGYSYNQQILTKANINAAAAGNITGLKFYLGASQVIANSNQVVVYVGLTNKATFTSTTDWIPTTALTQVFSGVATNNAGVVEITFSAPFAYDNVSNLVIAVDENKSGDDGGERFYTYSNGTDKTLYYRSDGTNPNPATITETGTRSATQSVVTLLGLTLHPVPVCPSVTAPVTAATGVSVTPTITWGAISNATGYKLSLGTTAGGTNVLNNVDVGNVTTYTLATSLAFNTQYFYTLSSYNGGISSVGCVERSFTTGSMPCPTVTAPTAGQSNLSLMPTFTWAAVSGATGYKISIGTTTGGTNVLNNQDVGNVTTYSLTTALSPSTNYFYTINSYNSVTASASCTERSFSTLCGTVANVPYMQDFETALIPSLPTCTSSQNVGTGNDWETFSPAAYGFTTKVLSYPYNAASPANTWFYTQGINLTAGTQYTIRYKYGNNGGTTYVEKMKVAYGTAATSTSMTNAIADYPSITNNVTAISENIVFTPTTSGVYYFGFNCYSATDRNRLFVDDITIMVTPSCTDPTAVVVSNITTNSATVAWTAPAATPSSGYQVYYNTSNTPPTAVTAPTLSVTATTTPLSPLAPSTTYNVWVRSNCGSSQSVWTSITSFTTLATPPANDNCANAIVMNPGATFAQNAITATNIGATLTSDATAVTSCQSIRYADVWYSVVVPSSGSITIETKSVTGSLVSDMIVSAYTGSCGALTSVGCNDDDGDGNFSLLSLTGQTPGSTLLIGAFNYSNTNNGQFQISAYDASLATSEVSQVKNNLKAYPNPFTDVLNISDIKNVKSVSIVDIAGRLVKTIEKPSSALQLGELNSGMYMVILNMNDGSKQTIKAIKK